MNLELNDPYWNTWLKRWFLPLLTVGFIVNISGLFVTILEPDGALYATIAKTIAQSGDFINLRVEGKDWLDKPHFPFWITAFSFKLFGISTVTYKLPALLFWALGGAYTYLLARALYSGNIARLSVLIYLVAAHLVISNNDVRAEPYLTGLIIGSVYHFYRASQRAPGFHLVLGSLLAACAVMTKGPFVLIVIASGFIADWVIKKQWKQFLHYRWIVALVLISIGILPEIYCLYQQFDLHPEKVVFGQTGVSGVRFFFWDSQFGRFLNNGPIKGKGDPLYFTHTILWAFLPWSLLLYAAVFQRVRNAGARAASHEGITIGTSLVTFFLFSFSRFQLPHYMNIVFPFFAILTARYIYGLRAGAYLKAWSWIQNILTLLLIALLVALVVLYHFRGLALIITVILLLYALTILLFRKSDMGGIVGRSFLTSALLYAFLNVVFYPALLYYQSGSRAAGFINKNDSGKIVCTYLENSYSLAFYVNKPVHYFLSADSVKAMTEQQELLVFTSENNLEGLVKEGLSVQVMAEFPHFHISQLKGRFLYYKTRDELTKKMVVASIGRRR